MTNYGPAEIRGELIRNMSGNVRQSLTTKPPQFQCPYSNGKCHKLDGVCTIRKFTEPESPASMLHTVCPKRFHQDHKVDLVIQQILSELNGVNSDATVAASRAEEVVMNFTQACRKRRVRIDAVYRVQDIFGFVEYQSCYFSGVKMAPEIAAIATSIGPVPKPIKNHRPDHLSSLRRLRSQLQQKFNLIKQFPELNNKIFVVIDRGFANELAFELAFINNTTNPATDLRQADVIWLIIDYIDDTSGPAKISAVTPRYTTWAQVTQMFNSDVLDKSAFMTMLDRRLPVKQGN
jgi:hypothetical protein